ncbi:MAG: helix-turn-helix domain-containing protein [Alphaproteobacteria bacterium]|nr:helix-turn-helix domain-containing protein [Alphaproteobacteria bacterium]
MDWSLELRTYRARNGLKQEALADLLEISQAYVSRLESGKTEPKDGLEHKIRSLISNPAQLDVLDFVLKSVRVSPHIASIMRFDGAEIFNVALSDGLRNHPQFQRSREGEPIAMTAVINSETLVRDVLDTGVFNGELSRVEVLWQSNPNEDSYHWDTVLTPIRGEDGGWYLYNAFSPLSAGEYQRRLEERGTHIQTFRSGVANSGYKNASFTAA